ncbi:MAG: EamA family transporter [Nitrospirota bacterium]|nr:EamA family transporter [Nitrospirota bacterium]
MTRGTLTILLTATFAAATGQLLFRVGARGRQELLDFVNLPISAGLVCYALGTALWIYALSSESLVNVYVFTALTFALVYLGGVALLGERLTPGAVAGVALVLAGLYLIVRSGSAA